MFLFKQSKHCFMKNICALKRHVSTVTAFGLKYNVMADKYVGMSGGRIIYQKLLEHDVKVVNGIAGGAIMNLLDEFHQDHHNGRQPIQFIHNSNEGNTGYVAEGYAKVSGKPGVIVITSGPALTNIITPLQDAMCDGVPLIALSGQVPTNAPPEAFQACDAVALTKPCTKWNYQLKSVDEIPIIMDLAFRVACSGRPGPVHIDCPKDIQREIYKKEHINSVEINMNDTPILKEILASQSPSPTSLDSNQLDNIVNLINKAERPILYIGHGAVNSSNELLEFVEKTNTPVTTTLNALGVFSENHPLALHMLGMHGHATANFMIQKADLILALGSRFDDRTVGNLELYAPVARDAQKRGDGGFIHVDIRASEKDRVVKVNEFVNSDCKRFLAEINKRSLVFRERSNWINLMNNYKENYPIKIPIYPDGTLSVQRVISELNAQVEPFRHKCIFTTGVGVHQMVAAQLITWTTPKSMITSGSLGTMGVAIGFAIGAKLAAPGKVVIAVDGDGSFNMTNTELKTIMNLQIPVKILLLNNNSEMMVLYWQKLFFDKRYIAAEIENCDYNKLADAYGIHNLYCDNEVDLSANMKKFLEFDGPILFHVNVRRTTCLPFVSPGRALDDLIIQDGDYSGIYENEVPS